MASVSEAMATFAELRETLKATELEFSAVNELLCQEEYYTTKDVARLLGCSEASAREYMNRPDFPRLNVGKGFKVSKIAFFKYNLEQRV